MRKRQSSAALPQGVQPQLLDIPEVAKALRIGRTKVYALIRTAGLPTLKVGSATRVSAASLQRWIEQQEAS